MATTVMLVVAVDTDTNVVVTTATSMLAALTVWLQRGGAAAGRRGNHGHSGSGYDDGGCNRCSCDIGSSIASSRDGRSRRNSVKNYGSRSGCLWWRHR